MKIAVWITSRDSEAFNFNAGNAERLVKMLPGVKIVNCRNSDEFKNNLNDADIVLVWVFKYEWFALAPKLKWIATPAAGKEMFDYEMPDGIRKTHGSFHGIIMAETLMGMMLSLTRGIIDTVMMQDKYLWPRRELTLGMGNLRGAELVIIGFGSIGTHIARLSKAFGMRITGVKRTSVGNPVFFEAGDRMITIDKLDEALGSADHVVLVMPNEPSTNDIMNERRLSLMKRSACLYNIGRGNSVDERALVKALKERTIRAAFLDVFKTEPLPAESELRHCPYLYLMPHASAISPQYMDLFADEFAREYDKWAIDYSDR